jgi:hypothetical protein
MAKSNINITEANLDEWLCSIGYLLPTTDLELERFDTLYPPDKILVREESVDPFAIINGTWKRKDISFVSESLDETEQQQLRMAARQNQDIPPDIMEQIKKNQKTDDQSNRPENS